MHLGYLHGVELPVLDSLMVPQGEQAIGMDCERYSFWKKAKERSANLLIGRPVVVWSSRLSGLFLYRENISKGCKSKITFRSYTETRVLISLGTMSADTQNL